MILEIQWNVPSIDLKREKALAGLEAFITYKTDLQNKGTFYTDSNGWQNVQRRRAKTQLESNFFPVTTSIFIQERRQEIYLQRELNILTDRSQAGTSLIDGQVSV